MTFKFIKYRTREKKSELKKKTKQQKSKLPAIKRGR